MLPARPVHPRPPAGPSGPYGKEQQFVCPSGASYSCHAGTQGCAFDPACCAPGAKGCPFPVQPPKPVGAPKKFVCPSGASYTCAAGTEGCAFDPACCAPGAKGCPFPVKPPQPPQPNDVCACVPAAACPRVVDACRSNPENPLCLMALPYCDGLTQEADNALEGYVSNAPHRAY